MFVAEIRLRSDTHPARDIRERSLQASEAEASYQLRHSLGVRTTKCGHSFSWPAGTIVETTLGISLRTGVGQPSCRWTQEDDGLIAVGDADPLNGQQPILSSTYA